MRESNDRLHVPSLGRWSLACTKLVVLICLKQSALILFAFSSGCK